MVERVHFKTKNSTQKILSVNPKNLLIRKWYPIQNQREACLRFERSDWFLVAPYFAIRTVSMETAKAVYFSSNNPANSK